MRVLVLSIWIVIIVANDAGNKYRRICYYSSWAIYRPGSGKFSPSDIDPFLCTHIIYAFAKLNEETGLLETFDPWADLDENYGLGGFTKVAALRQLNPRLKVMISVGGWNAGSTAFSDMVSTRLKRKLFIESALRFMRRYNFDGLDTNWEFPGVRGGRENDRENFDFLVQELRMAVEAEPALSGKPKLLISAAVSASDKTVNLAYNPATLGKHLDFISIMSYDFHGSWDNNVEHHSPIYGRHRDVNNIPGFNMVSAIKLWLNSGCPADKIVVGMPFYGRSFTLSDPHMTAPGSSAMAGGEPGPFTREPGFLAYFEVCSLLMDSTWTVVVDPEERTPYAYKEDQWIGFDDLDSIVKKTVIVREWGLGGVMIWSVDMDDFRGLCGSQNYPLLKMIRKILEFQPVRVLNVIPAIPQSSPHSFPSQMHPTIPARILAPSNLTLLTTSTTPAVIFKLEQPTPSPHTSPIAQYPQASEDPTPMVIVQAVLQPKQLFSDQAFQSQQISTFESQQRLLADRALRNGWADHQPMIPMDNTPRTLWGQSMVPSEGTPMSPWGQQMRPVDGQKIQTENGPRNGWGQQNPNGQQTIYEDARIIAAEIAARNSWGQMTPVDQHQMDPTGGTSGVNQMSHVENPHMNPMDAMAGKSWGQQGAPVDNRQTMPAEGPPGNVQINPVENRQTSASEGTTGFTMGQQTAPVEGTPITAWAAFNDFNVVPSRMNNDFSSRNTPVDIVGADSNNANGMSFNNPQLDLRPVECPAEGFYRNKQDCTRFYRCILMLGSWVVYHFYCPPPLVFDPSVAVCNWINMSPPCLRQ